MLEKNHIFKNKYNRPWKRTLPSLDLYRIRLTAFVEKSEKQITYLILKILSIYVHNKKKISELKGTTRLNLMKSIDCYLDKIRQIQNEGMFKRQTSKLILPVSVIQLFVFL